MSISYLLDSSVLVLSLKQDKAIHQFLARAAALYISTVALGEIYYGAEHSVHVKRSLAEVDKLAQTLTGLNADSATARIYGYIKHEPRNKRPISPDQTLGIAATGLP